MTDLDDYDDFDDDGYSGYCEPNCHTCSDSRWIDGKFRRYRPCPECNPGRLDRMRWTLSWWWLQSFGRLARRRRARMVFDDEGPF